MQLGWIFIALAVIFVILIIFLLIWAFKDPYEDATRLPTLWKEDALRRSLINSTINNTNDKQKLYEQILAMRYGMVDNIIKSKSLRSDVKNGCKLDMDLCIDMVNALKQSDNEKLSQLRSKWSIYADEMSDKVSKETKVDKNSFRKLMEENLMKCLGEAKQIVDLQVKSDIKPMILADKEPQNTFEIERTVVRGVSAEF